MNEIKILLVSDNEQTLNFLKGVFNDFNNVESLEQKDLKTELDRISPDLIFLVESENYSSVDLIDYIHSVNLNLPVVFIALSRDFDELRNVTRAGVKDVFVLPDENAVIFGKRDVIVQSVIEEKEQRDQKAYTTESFKRGRGKIFSFYSGNGGSGRTLLSSTFAQTLKLDSTAQVILVDLNLQFGGAETYLSIESNRSLADLLPVIQEINETHIRNVAEKEIYSKLDVLLSPRDVAVVRALPEEFVSKLLRTCRRSYDFVIVDLPTVVDENTFSALEESDKIFYVLNLDTPSISMLKQVETLFERLGIETNNRMELILNEVGKENEINPKDITNILPYPIGYKIPRDIKGVQSYINKSEPFRKTPNDKKLIPFSKSVKKWVNQFIE